MFTRTLAVLMLIASLTLITDSRSNAAAPAVELVYIVDSDQDDKDALPGDFKCLTINNNCTLRAALQEASVDGLPSRIKFASKMTISPHEFNSPYGFGYGVAANTVIDASDQWDGNWPSGVPGVTITGTRYTMGLLNFSGDDSIVRGIEFTGSGSKGIVVDFSKGTIIGGTEPGQRNVFSVYQDPLFITAYGVEIINGSSKTDVRGNYFGTRDGQNAFLTPGEYGINMGWSRDNFIRENLIVGQTEAGIRSWGDGHNLFINNIIGADKYLQGAIPNKIGIHLQSGSNENQIGPDNEISNNTQEGILIESSRNNLVMGNVINGNGNHGININSAADNRIGLYDANTISGNTGHGINIFRGSNIQILYNNICQNSEAGIYLEEFVIYYPKTPSIHYYMMKTPDKIILRIIRPEDRYPHQRIVT